MRLPPLRWQFHHLVVEGRSNSEQAREWWEASFAACPAALGAADVTVVLDVERTLPSAPAGAPLYREGDWLAYYDDGKQLVAYLPHYGRLEFDLEASATGARIWEPALHPGSLEDLVSIALSPHLRRRGLYLVHAFAAAREGRAVLLVGDTGAGKTTTGLALLDGGWKLLSNDSPLLDGDGCVLCYPSLISGYPDTFRHFDASKELAERARGDKKLLVAADTLWPGVWAKRAEAAAVLFPQIDAARGHTLQPLSPAETVQRLLPHTMEQWDKQTIGAHLEALRRLAEQARGYVLYLGPDVGKIGSFLGERLSGDW